ncbi:hypothetical protein [Carboxylicivirga sp. N1Y90]|uniref:hypothetical protein n=1 Tax=Carboxylicivirga fragile TaxID=3417571 RepID=UPI003D341608|nr:hypothetical protein [Marinilabiliaceae bacterium N1Y90]
MLKRCLLKNTILILLVFTSTTLVSAQSVSFDLKTSPTVNFDFNTVQKYISGVTIMNACELNIEAIGTQWDLYVGATTTVAGEWDVSAVYSPSGTVPTIDILQMQFRNASNTSLVPGFFPIQDILTPIYIIGSPAAPDPAINCPATGVNTAGNYLVSPGCYKFNVDLRVIPGFGLQPGAYSMRIDYILSQDL